MIFDKAENMAQYYEKEPLLKKCAEFIERFEAEKLPDGAYEIDGERVFANVQTYRTKQRMKTAVSRRIKNILTFSMLFPE